MVGHKILRSYKKIIEALEQKIVLILTKLCRIKPPIKKNISLSKNKQYHSIPAV